jgi:predicted Fe-S protein YdhL (DUF1289 family)
MDERTGWCLGCRRTIAEIAAWAGLAEAEKRRLLAALPLRAIDAAGRRGPG